MTKQHRVADLARVLDDLSEALTQGRAPLGRWDGGVALMNTPNVLDAALDVGITVADDYQRQGLGLILTQHLDLHRPRPASRIITQGVRVCGPV